MCVTLVGTSKGEVEYGRLCWMEAVVVSFASLKQKAQARNYQMLPECTESFLERKKDPQINFGGIISCLLLCLVGYDDVQSMLTRRKWWPERCRSVELCT